MAEQWSNFIETGISFVLQAPLLGWPTTQGGSMAEQGRPSKNNEWTGPAFQLLEPAEANAPVIVASPHSGRHYPDTFLKQSKLDPLTLRKSEDAYLDLLLEEVPGLGAPLLAAEFPRAFCDVNREPFELDPHMFSDALPSYANTRSVRVACGLGTLARIVSDGHEIYRGKLLFRQARNRIDACYRPYHDTLTHLVSQTNQQFGEALLLDFHSMPSVGGPLDQDVGHGRAEIVIGDRYGTAAAPHLVERLETLFRGEGFSVARNVPYAGGHTTLVHGRPGRRCHAIQIEINRALYLDERTIELNSGFPELKSATTRIISRLIADWGMMSQPLAAE